MLITRGSIYMAELPDMYGSSVEMGLRPVIIVQNDIGNIHSPVVQVIPFTSKHKKWLPVHVKVSAYGLAMESIALTEQIQTISKRALRRYLGNVDEETMKKINRSIAVQLGLQN